MNLPKFSIGLFVVLILVFFLRIPTFFEPYWYGDEGIYLAVGKVLHSGGILYRDVWDNKTPLIYLFYSIVPVLWWAKFLATVSVLGTIVAIYAVCKKVRLSEIASLLAASIAGVLLSIPRFEGTIANAELFFVLATSWGAYLVTTFKGVRNDLPKLIVIGVLASFAFLIKVPAVFDFIGMFVFISAFLFEILWNRKKPLIFVKTLALTFLPITIGFFIPLLIVVFYFAFNGSVDHFIGAAFLNNATYVSIGSGPLSSLSNPLFIKGLILLAVSALLIFLFLKRRVSKEFLFLSLWFSFSLFGSLLSNRPYLHYLLQIIPPATILVFYIVFNVRKYFLFGILLIGVFVYLDKEFKQSFRLQTIPYYQNFYNYESGKIPWEKYALFFDRNVLRTYEVSEYIRNNTSPNDSIFVWDDASNLYVLSNRKPATKFIQAHHLTLVDRGNYDLVIEILEKAKPKLILVDSSSRFKFSKLDNFIEDNYLRVTNFGNLQVYERS